jgi:hypothetical protein
MARAILWIIALTANHSTEQRGRRWESLLTSGRPDERGLIRRDCGMLKQGTMLSLAYSRECC